MTNAKIAAFDRARSFRLGTLLILTVLMLFVAVARVPTYAQTYSVLYSFSGGADGASPSLGSLFQGADGNFYGTTSAGGTHGSGTVFKITPSGKLTTIYGFCAQTGCADGKTPNGRLVQADDGNLYGTTNTGGANGYGTVFRLTRGGALTTLYSFCAQTNCADGEYPTAGLIQAIDGNL